MAVLVIGATGELGGEVVRALAGGGARVRAMTRRPEELRVAGAEVVRADLSDPASLDAAFRGVQRVFLVSSPTRNQIASETNAIDAAERSRVEHIVKISNLPIAGLDSGLHGNHRAIERRLAESPVRSTLLQPSFFASVLRRQLALLRRGRLVFPTGEGRIAWINPRDIVAVAAAVLLDPDPPAAALRLTGPEAITAAELAARIARAVRSEIVLVQPDLEHWHSELVAGGMDPWLAASTRHLYDAVARGALADVSSDVEQVLARPPRPIEEWIAEFLVPQLARRN